MRAIPWPSHTNRGSCSFDSTQTKLQSAIGVGDGVSHFAKRRQTKKWPHSHACRAKQRLELAPQHHVDLRHGHRHAEINEARHTVALPGHPARHDALEVEKVGLHVERDAMDRAPAL